MTDVPVHLDLSVLYRPETETSLETWTLTGQDRTTGQRFDIRVFYSQTQLDACIAALRRGDNADEAVKRDYSDA